MLNPGQARRLSVQPATGYRSHSEKTASTQASTETPNTSKTRCLLMQAKRIGGCGEQPVQELALNVDNVFQADDCDAYDSDVDDAPTEQTLFMANLSSVDPVYDEAGPSYDSDVLSEDNERTVCTELNAYGSNDAYVMIDNDLQDSDVRSVFIH
ncbi:hypothetical protein Tco_0691456 [Tanacetum coccineum]